MAHISKEELLKIASISQMKVEEDELDSLAHQLQDVLTYAERVAELGGDVADTITPVFNVTRPDQVKDPGIIQIPGQGPDQATGCFVVPLILDQQ